MRRAITAVIGALAVLALAGCIGSPTGSVESGPTPETTASGPSEPVAASTAAAPGPVTAWRPVGPPSIVTSGLDAPWSVVPLDDGTQLVSQRDTGEVLEIAEGGTARAVGSVAGVAPGGEGGLHGLALLETGAATWLYAYLGTDADNRVVRMPLTGGAGARALGPAETVVDGIPRAGIHNGGRIAFGPDGFLYVTTGDANLRAPAQDPGSVAGKILRLTPEGAPAPGNPFGNAVYSLGHRNVQGIAWTADGTMWASEFGQNTYDEVNRIVPGGNYGWPVFEGVSGDPAFVDPVITWTPAEASPSGLAAVGRTLFVAGLRGARVWALDVDATGLTGPAEPLWTDRYGRIRDAVVAGDALWLLTNDTDGRGDPAPEDDLLLRVPLASAT